MNPGNPIQNYLKCFMEQQKFFFDKEAFERREKLLAMPLKELPAQELQDYGGFALRQADWAARLDNPDWQILLKMKIGRVTTCCSPTCSRPPHRWPTLSRCGSGPRSPLGRFDDAIRTAKTMFAIVAPPGRAPDAHRQPGGHSRSRLRPSAPWRRCSSSRGAPTSTGH